MRSRTNYGVAIWLVLSVGACSSQVPPSAVFERNGCKLDLKAACEYLFRQQTFELNNEEYNQRKAEQNSRAHETFIGWVKYPNGDIIASAQCIMETEHMTAIHATLLAGPPITDKEVQYIKGLGLCTDESEHGPAANQDNQNS
jgi:hypothetical protein